MKGLTPGSILTGPNFLRPCPLAGMPDQLESWDKYLEMVRLLTNTGIITEVRDLWWDVRPHPGFRHH